MDIVDDLRKAPYEEERQYKREARIVLGGILEEAANEIEQLRKDKQRGFELMDVFVKAINRLKTKIAQDALEKE